MKHLKSTNKIFYQFETRVIKPEHLANMSMLYRPPYTPLLYSKVVVFRGINYFLSFALKHRLWVLVRTAPPRRF